MIKHLDEKVAERFYHGGRVFFYSDPHFSDVDSYKKRFPEVFKAAEGKSFSQLSSIVNNKINMKTLSVEQVLVDMFDQMQIDNINKVVHKNDTLVILGDVGNPEYVKKLKAGYKVLVMGNHDAGRSNYEKRTIKHLLLNGKIIPQYDNKDDYSELVNIHDEITWCGNNIKHVKHSDGYIYEEWFYFKDGTKGGTYKEEINLFDEVKEGTMQIGPKIMLSHEPLEHSDFWLNIHGHNHINVQASDTNHFNAIAECLKYFPISLDEIIGLKPLKNIQDIHRKTIDKAIDRKKKRAKTK